MDWKTMASTGMRVLLSTIVMLAAFIAGAMVSGIGGAAAELEAAAPAGGQEEAFGWLLLVSLLEAAVLGYLVLRSRAHGWKLAAALFLAMFGLGTVLPHIDSLIFLGERLPPGFIARMVVMGLVQAAIFAPAAVWILGRGAPAAAGQALAGGGGLALGRRQWVWKLALLAAVYVVLYFTFGYYVAWKVPAVREYYGGSDPGSLYLQTVSMARDQPWFFPIQLGRGLLWVLFTLPLVRTLAARRWELPLAVALLFSVWSWVLLMPNPLMPEIVARTHLVETLSSNFLFGAFVGWLLQLRPARRNLEARPVAAAAD